MTRSVSSKNRLRVRDDVRRVGPSAGGSGHVVAGHDHGGGAVAEQAAADQVGHRVVVALDRERAELDREQHGDLAGVADQVVVQPGDPGRPGDAAQPEERGSA